jgi:RNA polymerase sigma-70 factor (ECF subfamily)
VRDDHDVRLVEAMAAGDQEALAQLYERHSPWLLGMGIRIIGERQEAEDILHDVFVEAWRAATHYDARRGTVVAWLAIRMRSRALDVRRSPRISRNAGDGSLHKLSDGAEPANPDHKRVVLALDGLPPGHRRVVELAYFGQLSCSEVAERLAVPVGTVKSRLAAALTKLKSELRSGSWRLPPRHAL